MKMSRVRQNFHADCELGLNKQINMELFASYTYLSMAYYFDRSDVSLPGLYKYFKKASDEEREHAMKFMSYVNKRGGTVVLENILAPSRNEWGTAEEAMTAALDLEKSVNETLLELHNTASNNRDPHLLDLLESEFLQEQVESIKEISDYVTNLKRVGDGIGVYMFDKEFRE